MRTITLALTVVLLAGFNTTSLPSSHAQDSNLLKSSAVRFQPDFYAFQNGLGFGTAEQEATFLKQHGYAGVCQVFDTGNKLAERSAVYARANLQVASVYLNVNDTPVLEETVKPLANRNAIIELTVRKMSPDTVQAVRQTAEIAARLKMRVAHCPHHGNAIATMPQAIELVKKVGHSNLGIMFNLCHFVKNEKAETMQKVLKQASPHLFAVSTSGSQCGWHELARLDSNT